MRTIPGLRVIGAVLAAAAMLLGFTAPAHAQALVSNTVEYTLANPSNIGTGLQTFTAPFGARLDANSQYFVHVAYSGNGTIPRWNLTTNDAEDSGAATGWSIADQRHTRQSGGTGSWTSHTDSMKIMVFGYALVPAAPSGLKAEVTGDSQVMLTWDNPDNRTITGYQLRVDNGAWAAIANSDADTTSHTVTGLNDGATHSFHVRAVNDSGPGVWAYVDASIPHSLDVPAAPNGLAAVAGDGQVALTWDTPSDGNIWRWEYRQREGTLKWGKWKEIDPSGAGTTGHTVTDLTNGTEYTFAVRAVNGSGNGAATTASATPVAVTDEDTAGESIVLNVAPKSMAEEGGEKSMTVTAEMVGGTSVGVTTVTVEVTGHTASAADFAPVTDFTVIIKAGDLSGTATFTLTPISDVLMESDETVTVSGTADGFTVTGTEVTIEDDVTGATQARTAVNRGVLLRVTQAMAASTVTAVTGRIDAVTSGVGQVPSYNLASQQTLAGVMQTVSDGLRDGTLTVERLLGGSSFVLPLHATNDGQQTGLGSLAIWGRGDYRNLGGGDDIDWDGEILSGHLGVDTRLSADLLVGLAASWSKGSFDYTGMSGANHVEGSYTNRTTSVHPYVNWSTPAGVNLWGSLGYGWGELGIDEQGALQTEVSDTTMQTAAVGANGRVLSVEGLLPSGTTILRLKGEALLTNIMVEGDGGAIEPLSLDARRFRLALEGSHEHELASGGQLVPAVELGIRHDGGDGLEGTGLELGGGLRYVDPTIGLTVDGRGQWLVTYGEQEYREWGASLLIRMDPGAAGQGLSFSLAPAYGQTGSRVTQLWDQGLDGFGEASTSDASPRMEAVVGYGLPMLEGTGLVTPYSGVTLGSGGHQLRLGSTLAVGSSFNVSLEGTQAMRSEAPSSKAPPVYGVRLQADWRF